MIRLVRVLSLLFVACGVLAQDGLYWEVGFLQGEREAVRQAERISSAAGIEVWLMPVPADGADRYRLFIKSFSDEADQARLRIQLRSVGVEDPAPFPFDGNTRDYRSVFSVVGDTPMADRPMESRTQQAPMLSEDPEMDTGKQEPVEETMNTSPLPDDVSGYLIVAGSYKHDHEARAKQSELSETFDNVNVIEADVAGNHYYRVAVGPVSGDDRGKLIDLLVAAGIKQPWPLRYTGASLTPTPAPATAESPVSTPRRTSTPMPMPERKQTPTPRVVPRPVPRVITSPIEEEEQPPRGNGYNPAKLRKGTTVFPKTP